MHLGRKLRREAKKDGTIDVVEGGMTYPCFTTYVPTLESRLQVVTEQYRQEREENTIMKKNKNKTNQKNAVDTHLDKMLTAQYQKEALEYAVNTAMKSTGKSKEQILRETGYL